MENLFYQPDLRNDVFYLNEDESRHCVKVLRKRTGDMITITDGQGCFYTARITTAESSRCEFSIQDIHEEEKKDYSIHLAISPTKNSDRIEWMVEKCVEIGIDEISLLLCRNTERKGFNTTRLEKVAISAMKQSYRAFLPTINPCNSFQDFIKSVPRGISKFIAHVDHSNPQQLVSVAKRNAKSLILIGPEGDFSADEIIAAQENGFMKVGLSKYRLRTETAGLFSCSVLNAINN